MDNLQISTNPMTTPVEKPTPVHPIVPPPIPARHPVIDDAATTNTNNGKLRKQPDQPPELPPKTTRVLVTGGKFASPSNTVVPTTKTNPAVNKENHHEGTPESDSVSPSHQAKLVQRHKTKNNRRKMTEEEAINELG